MEEINQENFQEKVHNNSKTVIVDFYSETCPPCKQLAPVFEKVAENYKEKADFFKLNIIKNQEIFAEYGIQSIPTLIIFKEGTPSAETTGFKDEQALSSWLDENI